MSRNIELKNQAEYCETEDGTTMLNNIEREERKRHLKFKDRKEKTVILKERKKETVIF